MFIDFLARVASQSDNNCNASRANFFSLDFDEFL